jgi:PAS domain S-box-containing protein
MIEGASYMAHGYCLLWKPWLVTLHAGSDLVIFAAYLAIPVGIFIFLQQRKEAPLRPIAWLFVAFILLCGLTHIVNLITLWWPIYEIQGWLKLMTAIVSAATAVAVFQLIPQALAIPSPADLISANKRLSAEVESHQRTLADLRSAKAELDARLVQQSETLGTANALLEAINLNTPTMFYAKDASGRMQFASTGVLRYLDKSAAEVLGKTDLEFLPYPEQADAIMDTDRRVRESGETESIEEVLLDTSGKETVFLSLKSPRRDENGDIVGIVGVSFDITERKRNEERVRLLMGELEHRGRNQVAVISSLARQSLVDGREIGEGREAFLGRLSAIAESLQLVNGGVGSSLSLGDIVRHELHAHLTQVREHGPHILLNPQAAQTFALVVHELTTNALKYGALSLPAGRVDITWDVSGTGAAQKLQFSWTESNGPPTEKPARNGFGVRVIRDLPASDFGAAVNVEYATAGLQYSLVADRALMEQEGSRLSEGTT